MIDFNKNIPELLKAKWGASLEELLSSDPNRVLKKSTPSDYISFVGLAEIKDYEIINQAFEVDFMFDKVFSRLCRINMTKQYEDYHLPAFPQITGAFQMISMILTSKYGHPEKEEQSDGIKSTEWKANEDIQISLSTLVIEGFMSQLTISYINSSVFKDHTFGL